MNMQTHPQKALLAAPPNPAPAASQTMIEVARKHGVSPVRQMREMWTLKRGPGKLEGHEYHATGVYVPDMAMDDKKTYVGRIGSYNINVRLSPPKLTETRAFLRDKVMYTALLTQLSLPTTTTQAVVSARRVFGAIPALRNPDAVAQFLQNEAVYPIFAKPCEGAGSVGSALITGLDRGAGLLHLGNGRDVGLDSFAHEIFHDYPEGFILQSAIRQHPDMAAMTGDAVGTLRIVTLRDAHGVSMLYTVWKVPSPKAMSDNFWQAGSMVAEVDDTGRVVRCNKGSGLSAEWIDMHPVSQRPFAGFQIPHWDQVQHVAQQAHMMFPEFGIVGWDMAVGPQGPVIVECNDNPFHTLYQLATGRGILNTDFTPKLDAAAAESQAILRGKVAIFQAREKAKKRKA
ncbi:MULTISPECIES: sugar-transfer associated ATP-grasp domain-containing protein [Roseobacteraceae]|uniref:Sugar-transfer associated ATP-grasp n=1 Tax=Pseudosulfitobacter pseudonitzschiae TaxID=1402135 RepID=A0A221JX86_9RHOB|nr:MULTISPECIES: sugar-transfer associated ATP-grasp domain-containing protein [Roseobacteraceae]ASM71207.1 sugar-transfer associated ATP-grasp [Pseudosulfitobacter pseudonitzschiae]